MAEGAAVHVMTRSAAARKLATDLGAASVGDTFDRPPEPLDAAITFAPVGEIVPAALEALDRGGTLAIAGIHLTDIPTLRYDEDLFQERQVRSVTANTRHDGEEFLPLTPDVGRVYNRTVPGHDRPPGQRVQPAERRGRCGEHHALGRRVDGHRAPEDIGDLPRLGEGRSNQKASDKRYQPDSPLPAAIETFHGTPWTSAPL